MPKSKQKPFTQKDAEKFLVWIDEEAATWLSRSTENVGDHFALGKWNSLAIVQAELSRRLKGAKGK